MARKRTQETDETLLEQRGKVETEDGNTIDNEGTNEDDNTLVKPTIKVPDETEEIPDGVKAVLKVFAREPQLYVNPKTNGAFTADTQPSLVGEAILYKNPFYTKHE
jgi:hypothetical protein